MVDLAFGIFGAAMFAEPAVAKVEEVVGLIHGKKGVGRRVWSVGRVFQHPTPHPIL
jgi:hypothetical protein